MAGISDKGWDLGAYLREQREHARLSVRQLANLAGVSNPYLSQVERGLRKPSAEVLQQIARGLRISAEALYVRAGILDSEGRPDVEAAVNADPDLNDRQRRVLLDIYASFRAENRRASDGESEPEPEAETRVGLARAGSAGPKAAAAASAAPPSTSVAVPVPPEPAAAESKPAGPASGESANGRAGRRRAARPRRRPGAPAPDRNPNLAPDRNPAASDPVDPAGLSAADDRPPAMPGEAADRHPENP